MGHHVSDTLNAESDLIALKTVVKQRKNKHLVLIHHSDRRLQYCVNEYQNPLNKNRILCSMTQNSDPYENAVAERINGILKQEFMIDKYNLDLNIMKHIVKEAISTYNQQRLHYSNCMLTTDQLHLRNQIKMKTYKTKNSSKLLLTTV